jgi:heptosyltransferase-2
VPSTVIVRAPNWLGDTVMAMPALAGLRAGLPAARITVVGRWASLLRGQGIADVLVDYPRASHERHGIGRALAADPADLAVLLPNSFESALSAWRWRARRRIGFDTDGRGALLTDSLPLPEPRRHQVDEYRLLVEALGLLAPAVEPRLRPPCEPELEAEAEALLAAVVSAERPRIGLHLGVAGGPAKRWAAAGWAELADGLARSGLSPVLLGGPGDAPAAAAVLQLAARPPASLVGRDRPALLPHLLTRLRCLVSADTGVAHLGAALGAVTVTLFGPTDPRLSAPRSSRAHVVAPGAPCAPCFLAECPIEHPCMRAITAEAVASRVRDAVA